MHNVIYQLQTVYCEMYEVEKILESMELRSWHRHIIVGIVDRGKFDEVYTVMD